MNTENKIGSVEGVSLTVLVDNKANLIVESSDTIQYYTEKPLLAEHGFSALIQPEGSGETILWDAGVSKVALIENMRSMGLEFKAITQIALSHGHYDHYAAMTAVLETMALSPESKEWGDQVQEADIRAWLDKDKISIVTHPAAFRERWRRKDDGTLVGPSMPPPADRWKAAGAKIIRSEGPFKLTKGCWMTGYIPRKSFEESGRPEKLLYRNGADFIPDDLDEDQAIVIHLKDKGLVVLSGCAHSGIVNTVEYAQQFSGVDKVYAVMGGFHLARASEEEIDQTVTYFKDLDLTYIIPSHCTGFQATSKIAQVLPDIFVEGVVGVRYIF